MEAKNDRYHAMIYENKILVIIMCEISEAESSGIVAFIIMHLFF